LPLAIFYPLSSILAFGGRAAARPYRVFHLVSACFTWFQLLGKKNRIWDAEKWHFLATRNVSLERALRRLSRYSVSPCFTWLHLHHAKTR